MGQEISYADEWIELYNNTDFSLALEGWVLKAIDEAPEINLTGIIPKNGFYLLERTDDNSVPEIPADLVYKGILNNNGENLELYDNSGNLIDSVDCADGWFAGDNQTKQTMERTSTGKWQNSQKPGGTPKAENSIVEVKLQQRELVEAEPRPPSQEETESVTFPSGIIVNEILPSPEGPDAENEWIEIFNQNNFEIDLSNWQITDVMGSTKTYTFPKGTLINSKGYLAISRPVTKITLNNDGDGLKLSHPDGTTVDTVNYEKASLGESFNRVEDNWYWSPSLTPGEANVIPRKIEEIKEAEEKASEKKIIEEKGLAAISEPFRQPQEKPVSEDFPLFLIALFLAIFSGIIILFLKRRIKINYNDNV